jgi:hypothetical protein
VVTRDTSLLDIVDRVVDKGIVIEYHAPVSVAGIDTLITIDARWIVASISTYGEYADRLLETRREFLFPVRRRP